MTAPVRDRRLLPEEIAARLVAGEPAALSQAITAIENHAAWAPELLRELYPHLGRARVVGVTGSPGVGKSTLISAYVTELRGRGTRVGVVAVDPSSPLSGGAILGDRIRLAEHAADEGVFVRSLASRGSTGGLSLAASGVVDLMDAAGWDVVILETVGAGQAEVDVADAAQIKIVVTAPSLGDDIQAIKAGILEIADVLVLNKSDHPMADAMLRHLRGMLSLRAGAASEVPLVVTVATTGEGVPQLADTVEALAGQLETERGPGRSLGHVRRLLASTAAALVAQRIRTAQDVAVDELCREVLSGRLDLESAASRLLTGTAARNNSDGSAGVGGEAGDGDETGGQKACRG